MAQTRSAQIPLRDGTRVEIRAARPEDCDEAIAFRDELYARGGEFLVARPGEVQRDPEKLAERFAETLDDPRSVHLVAWCDGSIVGDALFRGNKYGRTRHTGWIGVGVRPGWEGRGLGRTLFAAVLDWAAAHDEIERVTLRVFCEHARALSIYRGFGFVEECRSQGAIKLEDGRYADEFSMCLYVKPGVAPEGFATYRPGAAPRAKPGGQ